VQRYFCVNCNESSVRKRKDLSQLHVGKIFEQRLGCPLNLKDFSKLKGVSDRTLRRRYHSCWERQITPPNHQVRNEVLIIDGFVLSSGFNRYRKAKGIDQTKSLVVLIVMSKDKVITWGFYQSENYASWTHLLSTLTGQPLAIACDGQKGMIKAIKELFPKTLIQRCHFHLLARNRQLLTLHPETPPAVDLTSLVKKVTKIKTRLHLGLWLQDYRLWLDKYDQFLKEKTYPSFDNIYLYKNFIKGKRCFFYTHQRLRSAHYQLKKALPFLFQYLKCSSIPNTSNLLEGGINSSLAELLRRHRGLTLSKQKILVANFLAKKC
jgi:hypothetical protein